MRRPVLIGILALSAALTVRAQAQVDIGIKGGVTFATLSETDLSPDFKTRTGFAAGAHFGIPLGGGNFLIQPEGLIAQLGTEVAGGGDLKVSYLMVPLNLRLNLLSGGIRPFILGGPYAAFKLSCNLEDLPGNCDDLDLSGTDWGVDFGAGLKFGGGLGLFAEARYNLGLKDISDISAGFDSKQRVFMVLAGISF